MTYEEAILHLRRLGAHEDITQALVSHGVALERAAVLAMDLWSKELAAIIKRGDHHLVHATALDEVIDQAKSQALSAAQKRLLSLADLSITKRHNEHAGGLIHAAAELAPLPEETALKSFNEVEWFAATNDIQRMGPYNTEVEAWAALKRDDGSPNKPGDRVWPEQKRVTLAAWAQATAPSIRDWRQVERAASLSTPYEQGARTWSVEEARALLAERQRKAKVACGQT
jgi:hypothetical protein